MVTRACLIITVRVALVVVLPGAYVSTDRYALTSDSIRLDTDGADWVVDELLGEARLEVTPTDQRQELFVGVADTADVVAYLSDVGHHRLGDLGPPWGRTAPGMTAGERQRRAAARESRSFLRPCAAASLGGRP